MDFSGRARRLTEALRAARFDAFLISHLPHLGYLFDFWGSAGLALWDANHFQLIVDGRYWAQAEAGAAGCEVVRAKQSPLEAATELLEKLAPERLALETEHLSSAALLTLQEKLPHAVLGDAGAPIEELRRVKEPDEVALIERAYDLTHAAMRATLQLIQPGATELEISAEITYRGLLEGGEELAFETLVASGPRTALPHAAPTTRRWEAGEPLLIDCGFRYQRYVSDYTRMVAPEAVEPELAAVVSAAQSAAFEALAPGAQAGAVDRAARDVIEAAGHGDGFTHSTGHGIGLEVHESPRAAAEEEDRLEPGMLLTLEPAVYRPGRGGVRIEDAAVVTGSGARWLSRAEAPPFLD